MLQKHSSLRDLISKYCGTAIVATGAVLLAGNASWAAEKALRLLDSMAVPVAAGNTTGGMFSFDISFVDHSTGTYYLADRSNKAVDRLDAGGGIVTQIFPNNGHAPFAGISPPAFSTTTAGPNGVVAAFPWLFVTDAPSRVLSFDLRFNPPKTVSECTTKMGDPTRADELAYDPQNGLILAINNASTMPAPFATLIKVDKTTGALTCGTNIIFDAAHGVDAQNGAEQPVWDPGTKRFYLSIPQIGANPTVGGVLRIGTGGKVQATYTIPFCSPAGLALGPNDELLVGCNTIWDDHGGLWTGNADRDTHTAAPQLVILDAITGAILANVLGAGVGDEVWFNKGDGNYYATGSGSPFRPLPAATAKGATPLGVVDAKDQKVLQQLTTYNVPAGTGHPAGTAHSVAANAKNNHIFVPLAANTAFSSFAVPGGKPPAPDCETGCIAVYGHPDEDPGNPQEDD